MSYKIPTIFVHSRKITVTRDRESETITIEFDTGESLTVMLPDDADGMPELTVNGYDIA